MELSQLEFKAAARAAGSALRGGGWVKSTRPKPLGLFEFDPEVPKAFLRDQKRWIFDASESVFQLIGFKIRPVCISDLVPDDYLENRADYMDWDETLRTVP